jgi:hypothetical protein
MFLPSGFVACQRGLGKRAAPREPRRALPRRGMLNKNHGADDYFIARGGGALYGCLQPDYADLTKRCSVHPAGNNGAFGGS